MATVQGSIDGLFFENQYLTAKGLGAFANGCLSDGILTGCGITITGGEISIAEGFIVIGGRPFYISEHTISGIETGFTYAAIVAAVDTTKTSEADNFDQVEVSVSRGNSISDLIAGLSSENVNLTGTNASTILAVIEDTNGTLSLVPGSIHYATARSMSLLWENQNPTTAIGDTTLTIPSLCFYDAVLIRFKSGPADTYNGYATMICPYVKGVDQAYSYSLAAPIILGSWVDHTYQRMVDINGGTGAIHFAKGWHSAGSSGGYLDTACIPAEIYGMSMH